MNNNKTKKSTEQKINQKQIKTNKKYVKQNNKIRPNNTCSLFQQV